MSKFADDLHDEQILSSKLDDIYNGLDFQFKREYNLDLQHEGTDVKIFLNDTEYLIDEKAQLHYLNKNLPTFAFELSYLNRSLKYHTGWLCDKSKKTQFYFLVTNIQIGDKSCLTVKEDIDALNVISVNRNKLISYLKSIGLDETRLYEYDSDIRNSGLAGRSTIQELNQYKVGFIHYTKHLDEKPINLVLKLDNLIHVGIAKKIYPNF